MDNSIYKSGDNNNNNDDDDDDDDVDDYCNTYDTF